MEVVERYFFPKNEHLCLRNDINRLFDEGMSFMAYPLRIMYLPVSAVSLPGVEVLISVSKKRFKRAVLRNRIKRLIREAYRLNGNALKSIVSQGGRRLHIVFMYVSNDLSTYKDMETGMMKAMKILENKIAE